MSATFCKFLFFNFDQSRENLYNATSVVYNTNLYINLYIILYIYTINATDNYCLKEF